MIFSLKKSFYKFFGMFGVRNRWGRGWSSALKPVVGSPGEHQTVNFTKDGQGDQNDQKIVAKPSHRGNRLAINAFDSGNGGIWCQIGFSLSTFLLWVCLHLLALWLSPWCLQGAFPFDFCRRSFVWKSNCMQNFGRGLWRPSTWSWTITCWREGLILCSKPK